MYSFERTNGLGEHSGGCSMWQVPRSPLEWGIMTSESADLHSLSSWSLLVAAVRGHIGQNRQLDSVRFNASFFERADALIVAAGQREVHSITHAAYLALFIAIANQLRIDSLLGLWYHGMGRQHEIGVCR